MKDYKRLNLPLLTKQDEEFQMLLEVAEEYTRQKSEKTPQKKSGDATEIVVRNHLLKRGLNITEPKVSIEGCSDIENDLFLLKPNVNPKKEIPYEPDEVDMVIEIKNNAVPSRRNKMPIQPSDVIRENFNRLEKEAKMSRFAVVVLSERLLSKTPYKYAITEDKIRKKNCRVFTLVTRREYPQHPKYPKGGLYHKEVILQMLKNNELWKTGEWEELIAYLKKN